MKKRLAITSLTCLLLLISCLREEYGSDNALQRKEWFRYTDPRLAPIAETMRRIEDDKPFMDVFCKTYGIPLWDYADIYQETGDDAVHFWIPLYHNDYPNEIRTIWYFKMENDLLDYAPITRDAEFIKQYGQDFQFDYLSYRVFGPKNAAGMEFRDRVETRSEYGSYEVIGYECKDAYVIIELDGMTSTTYKGTICKEIKVWVDYMDENISSLPDGSGGGGGGGGSGSDVPVGGQGEAGTEAKKIFENKNMTDYNWKTLDKMIEKI